MSSPKPWNNLQKLDRPISNSSEQRVSKITFNLVVTSRKNSVTQESKAVINRKQTKSISASPLDMKLIPRTPNELESITPDADYMNVSFSNQAAQAYHFKKSQSAAVSILNINQAQSIGKCLNLQLKPFGFPLRTKKNQDTNKFLANLKSSRQMSQAEYDKGSTKKSLSAQRRKQRGDEGKHATNEFKERQCITQRGSFFDIKSDNFPISKYKQKEEQFLKIMKNNEIFKNTKLVMKKMLDLKIDDTKLNQQPLEHAKLDHFKSQSTFERFIPLKASQLMPIDENLKSKLNFYELQLRSLVNKLKQNLNLNNESKCYNLIVIFQIFQMLLRDDLKYQFKEFIKVIYDLIMPYLLIGYDEMPQLLKDEQYEFQLIEEQNQRIQEIIDYKVPFFEVYRKLLKRFLKMMTQNTKHQLDQETKISQLTDILQDNKKLLDQEQIDLQKQKDDEIKQNIQERLHEIVQENAELHKEKNVIQFKLSETVNEMEELFMTHQKLKKDFKQVNEQRLKLMDENQLLLKRFQDSEKLKVEMEIKLKEKHKLLETTVIIIQNNKTKIETLQTQVSNIQTQNSKLAVRGATSFIELTPRYEKFKDVFQEFHISIDQEEIGKKSLDIKSKNLVEENIGVQKMSIKSSEQDTASKDEDANSQSENEKKVVVINKIPQKYSSNDLIERLIQQLRKVQKKYDKLKDKDKHLQKSFKKQNEQIQSLSKQVEQLDNVKKKLLFQSQGSLSTLPQEKRADFANQRTLRRSIVTDGNAINQLARAKSPVSGSSERRSLFVKKSSPTLDSINLGGQLISLQNQTSQDSSESDNLIKQKQISTNSNETVISPQETNNKRKLLYEAAGIIIEEDL